MGTRPDGIDGWENENVACLRYANARYYDACLGRFHSTDADGQAVYVALADAPLEYVDLAGRKWFRYLSRSHVPASEYSASLHGYERVVPETELVTVLTNETGYHDDVWLWRQYDLGGEITKKFGGWNRTMLKRDGFDRLADIKRNSRNELSGNGRHYTRAVFWLHGSANFSIRDMEVSVTAVRADSPQGTSADATAPLPARYATLMTSVTIMPGHPDVWVAAAPGPMHRIRTLPVRDDARMEFEARNRWIEPNAGFAPEILLPNRPMSPPPLLVEKSPMTPPDSSEQGGLEEVYARWITRQSR